MASAVERLTGMYTASRNTPYGSHTSGADLPVSPLGGVGFLAHSLQCADQAFAADSEDSELHVAALLHDVGWLLPRPSEKAMLTGGTDCGAEDEVFIARHDVSGSRFLAGLGFPPRVCHLVAGHVQAKRFLVATEPAYAASLSPGSVHTLRLQGGPMNADEVKAFQQDPDHQLTTALRRWDEGAKAQPYTLQAVLNESQRKSLGPDGPGYIVLRAWLTATEVAALKQYASHTVPAMDGARVHHTYESIDNGQLARSRTEYFGHMQDADGVGAHFLMDGRLREMCAALREGRDMVIYKEKINYKMAGGSGGYLPHQDYYFALSENAVRGKLLPDSDICVCMVAVDDMDGENGCPEVAAGHHTRGPLDFKGSPTYAHLTDFATVGPQPPPTDLEKQGLPMVDPADMEWTPVHLSAGDVLIYGNLMPHRSGPNMSDRDRRALFAVYSDAAHGRDIRTRYYEYEARNRRAAGSAKDGGKANSFFTGVAVHVPVV